MGRQWLVRPETLADAYVFDMDGTIYLGDELLPGAKRFVLELQRRGIPVRFLSNNPTKDPEQYAEKLGKLGIDVEVSDIVNTLVTTVRWLRENHDGATVFPIGEAPLVRALEQAGIKMSERPEEIDIVIASYDRSFDYRKLQIAFDAIWFHRRAILIQTNPDRYCPFPEGRGEPDAAAITAAIEACTGVKCEASLGKPSPIMLAESVSDLDIPLSRMMMVGDRLHTDIAMAVGAGMPSGLVLTGEAKVGDLSILAAGDRPSYVVERLDHLMPQVEWKELGWRHG